MVWPSRGAVLFEVERTSAKELWSSVERISRLQLLKVEDALQGSTFFWTWSSTLNWRKKQSVRDSSRVPRSLKDFSSYSRNKIRKPNFQGLTTCLVSSSGRRGAVCLILLRTSNSLMAKMTFLLGFCKAISGLQQMIQTHDMTKKKNSKMIPGWCFCNRNNVTPSCVSKYPLCWWHCWYHTRSFHAVVWHL